MIYPFLPERIKVKKFHNFVCNLYNKDNYVAHTRTLKQALNYGLILKKVHRAINFNQKSWLTPYIDMNTKLRTEENKDFFKLMNNAAFGKTMANVRKHRNIKLATTNKKELI